MGIDPAYRSPSFGIVVVHFVDGQLQILQAEEYKRPDFNEMLGVKYSESLWYSRRGSRITIIAIDFNAGILHNTTIQ